VGERADFNSRIGILEGKEEFNILPLDYPAIWEGSGNTNISINKNGKERLFVAELQNDQGIKENNSIRIPRKWVLYGHFEKDKFGELPNIITPPWDVKIPAWDGKRQLIAVTWAERKEPKIILRVVITSNPSMEHSFSKDYQLTIGGLAEMISN
jgi:hypothetical protein